MKIIAYELIWSRIITDLNPKITHSIKNGWQPYGSPFAVVEDDGQLKVCQAVVKYDLSEGLLDEP